MGRLIFVVYVFVRNPGSKMQPVTATASITHDGFKRFFWLQYLACVYIASAFEKANSCAVIQAIKTLFVCRVGEDGDKGRGEGEMFREPAVATHWCGRCLPVSSRLPFKAVC